MLVVLMRMLLENVMFACYCFEFSVYVWSGREGLSTSLYFLYSTVYMYIEHPLAMSILPRHDTFHARLEQNKALQRHR